MPTMNHLAINSEIGRLRRVILHSPGPEIESMTPREAEQDLYNDIIPLQAVLGEYTQLKDFLCQVAEVSELVDLLADCLEDAGNKFDFLTSLGTCFPIRATIKELMAQPAPSLAAMIVQGIAAPKKSFAYFLNNHSYASRPLPNAYFMRDSAAVIGNCALAAATAYDVRMVEAYITRFIFTHHPDFVADNLLFDGPSERNRYITMEGGDILVLSSRTLVVGISERTTPFAIERVARNMARIFQDEVTVFAIDLPKTRATIHLDMVFTMIDRDCALVYEPVITGNQRSKAYRIDAGKDGRLRYSECESLLSGLKSHGFDLQPVFCGNRNSIYQEREQWLSGANSFAFAPGKIIMYSCNSYTMDALANAGFAVKYSLDFMQGKDKVENYGRLVVAFDGIELARGGGGPRCMTLPVERDSLF
ncbi:MAG: hypothetical protein LLF89_03475 [Spirochaetaceae bacterium]|nr:hypothetical protein [Spirochaetaceae bacterium]